MDYSSNNVLVCVEQRSGMPSHTRIFVGAAWPGYLDKEEGLWLRDASL